MLEQWGVALWPRPLFFVNFVDEQTFVISFMKYITELVALDEGLEKAIGEETFRTLVSGLHDPWSSEICYIDEISF